MTDDEREAQAPTDEDIGRAVAGLIGVRLNYERQGSGADALALIDLASKVCIDYGWQRRRLDEARAQSGWRPIETAPEGEHILLATDQGGVSLREWVKYEHDQWCKHGHSMPYLPVNWTHWMPLPAPPALEEG